MKKKKKVGKYTLKQVKEALGKLYQYRGHKDDWDVPVVYLDTMMHYIGHHLLKTKKY